MIAIFNSIMNPTGLIPALALLVLSTISFCQKDVFWGSMGVASFFLCLYPIMKSRRHIIPTILIVLILIPLLLHTMIFFETTSDSPLLFTISEFSSSIAISVLGLIIAIDLMVYTEVRMNGPFIIFFVILFAMGVENIWVLGEYISDSLLGTNLIISNYDLMIDMIYSFIGSLLGGFILYLLLIGKGWAREGQNEV